MLAKVLRIGRSRASEIVNDTTKQIVSHLVPKYVRFPNGDRLREIVEGFKSILGYLQAVGAIFNGTHIPISFI